MGWHGSPLCRSGNGCGRSAHASHWHLGTVALGMAGGRVRRGTTGLGLGSAAGATVRRWGTVQSYGGHGHVADGHHLRRGRQYRPEARRMEWIRAQAGTVRHLQLLQLRGCPGGTGDRCSACASTTPQAQSAAKAPAQTGTRCSSGTGDGRSSTPDAQRCKSGYVATAARTNARQPPHHQRHEPQHSGTKGGGLAWRANRE